MNKPILVLTIREHGMEDDIYVFANRNVNVLPTIKEWLVENDIEFEIPDIVTDSESFWQWYLNIQLIPDKAPNFFVSTHLKQLLDE